MQMEWCNQFDSQASAFTTAGERYMYVYKERETEGEREQERESEREREMERRQAWRQVLRWNGV